MPTLRYALPDGMANTPVTAADGSIWVNHFSGLFRCHQGEVSRSGKGCVGHNCRRPHFHGFAGLGRFSYTGVDNNGQIDFINENLYKFLGRNPLV